MPGITVKSGLNYLYVYQRDLGGFESRIIFSATITVRSKSPYGCPRMYAIDATTDSLVRIDPLTAQIYEVGPIGFDVGAGCLDFDPEGNLWGIVGDVDQGIDRLLALDTEPSTETRAKASKNIDIRLTPI